MIATLSLLATMMMLLASPVAWAVPEAELLRVYNLLDEKKGFYTRHSFKGNEVPNIHYLQFGSHKGPLGSVVLSPGHREASIDWIEWAHDLIAAGFSPVYAIDHSGQGFSDRYFHNEPLKTHITSYKSYYKDFNTWLKLVRRNPLTHKNLYLVALSMGGLIATHYLAHTRPRVVKASVLMAPMYKIHPQLLGSGERWAYLKARVLCAVGLCEKYVFERAPRKKRLFQNNVLTHSLNRLNFGADVEDRFPRTYTKGPTLHWAKESILASRAMREQKNINIGPVLMMYGDQERVVDTRAIVQMCQLWSRRDAPCTAKMVRHARHGIYIESDPTRNAVLHETIKFFNTYKP